MKSVSHCVGWIPFLFWSNAIQSDFILPHFWQDFLRIFFQIRGGFSPWIHHHFTNYKWLQVEKRRKAFFWGFRRRELMYERCAPDEVYCLTVVVPIMHCFVQGHVFSVLWSTCILIYGFLLLASHCFIENWTESKGWVPMFDSRAKKYILFCLSFKKKKRFFLEKSWEWKIKDGYEKPIKCPQVCMLYYLHQTLVVMCM